MDSENKIASVSQNLTGNRPSDRKMLTQKIQEAATQSPDPVYQSGLFSLYYFSSDFDNLDDFLQVLASDEMAADDLAIALKALERSGQIDRAAFLGQYGAQLLEKAILENDLFPAVAGTDYRNFNNRIEEILYLSENARNHQLIRPRMNYSNFYARLSGIFLKQDDAKAANTASKKALEWNPYNVDAWLNGAEASFELSDLNGYFEKTKRALGFCYKPNRLAKCYHNFGNYYEKMQLIDISLACYAYAYSLNPNDEYQDDLGRLMKLLQADHMPSARAIAAALGKYNIPLNTSPAVVKAAFFLGKLYHERHNEEAALKYLSIADQLADFPEVKSLIQEITSHLN